MYTVTWTIEVEADSRLEAAREARKIQLDRDSLATEFAVDDDEEPTDFIDLAEHAALFFDHNIVIGESCL